LGRQGTRWRCVSAAVEERDGSHGRFRSRGKKGRKVESIGRPLGAPVEVPKSLWEQTKEELGLGKGRWERMGERVEERRDKRIAVFKRAMEQMVITEDVEALLPLTLVKARSDTKPMVGKPMFDNVEAVVDNLMFYKVQGGSWRDGISRSDFDSVQSSYQREKDSQAFAARRRNRGKDTLVLSGPPSVSFHSREGRGHHMLGERLLQVCTTLYMREHFPHMSEREDIIRRFAGAKAIKSTVSSLYLMDAAAADGPLEPSDAFPFCRAILDVLLSHAYEQGGTLHAHRLLQTILFPQFTSPQARRSQGLIWALQALAPKMPVKTAPDYKNKTLLREAERVVHLAMGRRMVVEFKELPIEDTTFMQKVTPAKRKRLLKDLSAEPLHRRGLFVNDVLVDDGLGMFPTMASAAAARNFLATVYSWPACAGSPVRFIVNERKRMQMEKDAAAAAEKESIARST